MSADLRVLTAQTVPDLWEQRHAIFQASEVDLAQSTQVDSAGIAFLVQWAKHQNNKLRLLHASANIKSLIKTFHLEPIFELVD